MSKVEDIKNQLARRLEKQQQTGAQRSRSEHRVTAPLPEAADGVIEVFHRTALADTKTKTTRTTKDHEGSTLSDLSAGSVKLSVSLYNFDIQCLDRIRDFMRGHGVRTLSDSEALRLACRAVEINDSFLNIHQEMQKEDRRRRGR